MIGEQIGEISFPSVEKLTKIPSHFIKYEQIMEGTFSIAFEQVELVNGLAPDQPVWLFMRATLKDLQQPNFVIDVRDVGSFPPDANRPLPPGYPIDNSGLYATGLQIATPMRNDTHDQSTGQVFPRFTLDHITVAEGQVLEVEIFMLPRVWFQKMTVSQDDFDRWARSSFTALLGASGFGLAGLVLGGILGGIWGTENIEATIPCFQTVISARHVFTLDDLRQLATEPMRRFGPNDNEESICGFIDSFYWISANRHRPWSFGSYTPVEKQDCQLRPWRHEPVAEWLQGNWLDRESWETSCLGIVVNVPAQNTADIYVYDHPHNGNAPFREFLHRPIERDLPPNQFSYNFFGGECPARSAVPICPNCKRFTNLPHFFFLPVHMIAALALGPRHIGAEGWAQGLMKSNLEPRCLSNFEIERRRELLRYSGELETSSLSPSMLFRREDKDKVVLWPNGTIPPNPHTDPASTTYSFNNPTTRLHDGTTITDILFGCFKVLISEHEALFTYSEVPVRGKPNCPRLRYMKWDEEGSIVKDVMLQRWIRPPH